MIVVSHDSRDRIGHRESLLPVGMRAWIAGRLPGSGRWLKNPVEMVNDDSTVMRMPSLTLSTEEVDALINDLAQQTQEHRVGR